MLLPAHEFRKPESLDEALTALREARGEARLVGGGTDVVFNMRGKLFRPDILVSVKDLQELQQVEETTDGALRIGAGCRLSDLERHALQRRGVLLKVRGVLFGQTRTPQAGAAGERGFALDLLLG